jgi:glycosyltransferase involved in cell wall biosynthesis
LKIAIVHDWLVTYAGSERVLEEIIKLFPNADLFSVVDFIPNEQRTFLLNKKVNTTFIQNIPLAKSKYRSYLPLMPLAIEQLDLSPYDLIISSSHAVSKGVITGPEQLHISYVHSPIRYAWDLQHEYLKQSGLNKGVKGCVAKYFLKKMRDWDYRTSNGVDYFISNSNFISKRIYKVYRRESTTIYPPVDTSSFSYYSNKEDFYLTASRMVPYKKIDLIVDAFSEMPDKKLTVIGTGPDIKKIRAKANGKNNITILGYQSFDVLKDYMQKAKGFVFAAEEDFGIIPVEAQACGTPVIAFGKGGSLETVRGPEKEEPTGMFFQEQTVNSLKAAINKFEENNDLFKSENCRKHALTFKPDQFQKQFMEFVNQKVSEKWGSNKTL